MQQVRQLIAAHIKLPQKNDKILFSILVNFLYKWFELHGPHSMEIDVSFEYMQPMENRSHGFDREGWDTVKSVVLK